MNSLESETLLKTSLSTRNSPTRRRMVDYLELPADMSRVSVGRRPQLGGVHTPGGHIVTCHSLFPGEKKAQHSHNQMGFTLHHSLYLNDDRVTIILNNPLRDPLHGNPHKFSHFIRFYFCIRKSIASTWSHFQRYW